MSGIQGDLTEISCSLEKIENLSVKIKRHYFRRQNTVKQVKTLKKFVYLEEFITSKLRELSETQTDIQILSQLNTQIDDLQERVEKFEGYLNDEYWNRYCEIQISSLSNDYLCVEEDLGLKKCSKSWPEIDVSNFSTSESLRCEEFSSKSCKCEIF